MVALERLAILGIGLIGGSLAAAVRAAGLARVVVGWGRRQSSLEVALSRGLVDQATTDPIEAIRGAEVIVLAVPVGACAELARRIAPHADPAAVVTDVGSVKAPVVRALEATWPDPTRVVGGHPVAGSEQSGAQAARADLFRGRRCILTPSAGTNPDATARIAALWRGVGAVVETMAATRHDEILAWVSHLPHVLAYALVEAVGRVPAEGTLAYAGSGFEDSTRIAASPPELWRDIVLANAPAVLQALEGFQTVLGELESAIRRGDGAAVEGLMASAQARRRSLGS